MSVLNFCQVSTCQPSNTGVTKILIQAAFSEHFKKVPLYVAL